MYKQRQVLMMDGWLRDYIRDTAEDKETSMSKVICMLSYWFIANDLDLDMGEKSLDNFRFMARKKIEETNG